MRYEERFGMNVYSEVENSDKVNKGAMTDTQFRYVWTLGLLLIAALLSKSFVPFKITKIDDTKKTINYKMASTNCQHHFVKAGLKNANSTDYL